MPRSELDSWPRSGVSSRQPRYEETTQAGAVSLSAVRPTPPDPVTTPPGSSQRQGQQVMPDPATNTPIIEGTKKVTGAEHTTDGRVDRGREELVAAVVAVRHRATARRAGTGARWPPPRRRGSGAARSRHPRGAGRRHPRAGRARARPIRPVPIRGVGRRPSPGRPRSRRHRGRENRHCDESTGVRVTCRPCRRVWVTGAAAPV